MNNDTTKENNNGYIFAGMVDICLYGILSLMFPILSFYVEIVETQIEGVQPLFKLLFSELFVVATFFYDFYSRYRDCENQTKFVVYALCIGRTLFFVAIIVVLILMFLAGKNMYTDKIEDGLFIMPFLCFYPFVLTIQEAHKRLKIERNRKISKRKS